ncbi:MAG TPA: hypothetical protein VJH03_24950 [Blastocatellia bacterium]|nr:hypothetical protein [Blastocatellia bacterium]
MRIADAKSIATLWNWIAMRVCLQHKTDQTVVAPLVGTRRTGFNGT